MAVLKGLGVALIVIWLVLWLAVKLTFAAVHLLLLVGLAMIVVGFLKSKTANS
jgi:Flp pilus assembly protein TadB